MLAAGRGRSRIRGYLIEGREDRVEDARRRNARQAFGDVADAALGRQTDAIARAAGQIDPYDSIRRA